MSTEGFPAVRRCAVLAVGVAVFAPPAIAAQVDFRPVLTFGAFHNGNVEIIGENTVSDENAAIAVDLEVTRTTSSSSFAFFYLGRYVGYRQNSDLDYLGNELAARYTKEISRRSLMQAIGAASRTDSQGIAGSTIDPRGVGDANVDRPLTFVTRTTLTRAYGSVSGSVGFAQRLLVDWAVRASVDRYDEVPGAVFNNNTAAGVLGGWRYELSENTTLGLALNLHWYGYEVTDDSYGETIVFTGTHRLGRSTGMTFDVGATRTWTGDLSTIEGTFLLAFTRELTAGSSLSTGVRQFVSPGTGLEAATIDAGAWVSYSQSTPRRGLFGAVDGAYWFRKTLPTAGTSTSETETLNLAGAMGWKFNRFLSLSAAYAYYYQNAPNVSGGSLDTRYASYGLFLQWAIRGLADSQGPVARFPQVR